MSASNPERAIILDDGSYHYGLIRTPSEKTFAMTYRMAGVDLPPVDIASLPDNQGISNWLRIENQMTQGACTGHARSQCEEVAYYRQTKGKVIQLSRQFAYVTGQKQDGIVGDNGATIEGSVTAATKFGSCLETFAPYTGKYYTQFSQAAYANALEQRTKSYVRMGSYDDVLRWLVWGVGGCQNGIGWNNSMEPDSQGRVTRYVQGGGGHSLALVDWNKKFLDSAGRPFIQMDNSWDITWGFNGRAFIAPSVVDFWCRNETIVGYSELAIKDIVPLEYDWLKQSFWV